MAVEEVVGQVAAIEIDAHHRQRREGAAHGMEAGRAPQVIVDDGPAARRRLMRDRRPAPAASPAPAWLTRAVEHLREDPSGGVHMLVRACGRSREHVARSVRRCYETTPSTLANHLRCDLAARRLRLTTKTIVAIAQDVGFADLAHFYRCFRARHGCPPRAYRRTHRAPV